MSGLTGLIDTLLAAKLSQRLDVLAIKSEVEIAGPGPVIQVQKVDNDVRLLSNAALDRQIAADAPGGSQPAVTPAPAAQLSMAARAIGVLLAEIQADAGPVRGAAPVWPSTRVPASETLAATLARAVSVSGLFYESHLAQFAAGQLPLAQLAQEPQAAWGVPAAASAWPMPVPVETAMADTSGSAATGPRPSQGPGLPIVDGAPGAVSDSLAETIDAAGAPASVKPAGPPAASRPPGVVDENGASPSRVAAPLAETHAASGAVRADAMRVQATYRQADAAAAGTALDTAAAHRSGGTAPGADGVSATAQGAADIIHPQAATIVHQQLDLLATAVFRWSGHAWPGTPMAWSIHEDKDEAAGQHADPAGDESARRWTTTLSLSLPKLGTVDVRLSLAGPMVQAHVAASDAATLVDLRMEGRALARRLETVGLRLQDLQITGMPRP